VRERNPRAGSGTSGEPALKVEKSVLESELDERLRIGQQLLDRLPAAIQAHRPGPIATADLPALVERHRADFNTWDEFNRRLLRSRFSTDKIAEEYEITWLASGSDNPWQDLDRIRQDAAGQMRKLASIREQLGLFEPETEEDELPASPGMVSSGAKVFVVHGHDGDIKYQVAELLQKITGVRPVILHEQVDSGRTIIEKFEDHASEAGYAVVLLTADDVGRAANETDLRPRARQNVVFELGFFIGRLGRGRVMALHQVGVELPSDLSGVLYKPLAGNWHTELAKELVAAGIKVDLRKLLEG
jgi:predicted nucleotide-binding protein